MDTWLDLWNQRRWDWRDKQDSRGRQEHKLKGKTLTLHWVILLKRMLKKWNANL